MGFVILGIFTFTMRGHERRRDPDGEPRAVDRPAVLRDRRCCTSGPTRATCRRWAGSRQVTPWIAAAFLVATLSSIGLPGLNNFVGEFLVILGSFGADRVARRDRRDRRRPRARSTCSGPISGRSRVPGAERHRGLRRPAAARGRGRRAGRRGDAGARRLPEARARPDQPVLGRGRRLGPERRRRPGGASRAASAPRQLRDRRPTRTCSRALAEGGP